MINGTEHLQSCWSGKLSWAATTTERGRNHEHCVPACTHRVVVKIGLQNVGSVVLLSCLLCTSGKIVQAHFGNGGGFR